MANTSGTKRGTSTRRSTSPSSKTKKAPIKELDDELDDDIEETPVATRKVEYKPTEVDQNQWVVVRNGFQGQLVYKSPRSGEVFVWDSFGSEQEMELRELMRAKNTSKKFFINNWFMFDDDWIIDYLGVRNYYKHAVKIEDFDEIFNKSSDELQEIINEMSEGQKRSLAYRARQLIAENKIDSLAVITTLEESLGVELIER